MSPLRMDCELHKGSDLVRSRKGGLSSFSVRKTYRINFPSSEEIVLSPWVCFWSPHLVPLGHSRSGTWLFFLVQPSALLQAAAEAKFPNPPDGLLTLVNTCPQWIPAPIAVLWLWAPVSPRTNFMEIVGLGVRRALVWDLWSYFCPKPSVSPWTSHFTFLDFLFPYL